MSDIPEGSSFEDRYPSLADWIIGGGWVEIGYEENTRSFIRVLDEGGMPWAGERNYPSIDAALEAAEAGVNEWVGENG
jgi:hypothetical protein